MRVPYGIKRQLLTAFALLCGIAACPAFSLLGPYAKWMSFTNNYRQPGDIGGPMNIGQGYRWNVPVVTYAFDKSFLDFFGSNGVAAVEQAIAILNRLPSASQIVLASYPLDTLRENYTAEGQRLYDLKSAALSLLLEHMGLAETGRNVLTLRRWNSILQSENYRFQEQWESWFIPTYIIKRNFDPQTLQASQYVNGVLESGSFLFETNPQSGSLIWSDVIEYPVDIFEFGCSVADKYTLQNFGFLHIGLTRDDVGGWRYLLSTNTISYETLLPDVHPPDPFLPAALTINAVIIPPPTTPQPIVNRALRPGVEKVTFMRHPYTPLNKPATFTYRYTDTYIVNAVRKEQVLERSVREPDFLFSAADLNQGYTRDSGYSRTDTSKWWNSVAGNTNTDRAGPGVIHPPAKITFHRRGGWVGTTDEVPNSSPIYEHWGSFGLGTNAPIVYHSKLPLGSPGKLTISFYLYPIPEGAIHAFTWQLPVRIGSNALLQTSINLRDWDLVTPVANDGTIVDWYHSITGSQRFFRAIPE